MTLGYILFTWLVLAYLWATVSDWFQAKRNRKYESRKRKNQQLLDISMAEVEMAVDRKAKSNYNPAWN